MVQRPRGPCDEAMAQRNRAPTRGGRIGCGWSWLRWVLRGYRAQHADQLTGFEGQLPPGSFVIVELARPSDLFERACRGDDALGVEVRGGAFQSVGRAPQRFPVARVECLADAFEMTRRVVDEQAADLREQLTIAADAREDLRRNVGQRDFRGGGRLRVAVGDALDERTQLPWIERLGQGFVPAARQTAPPL